MLSVYKGIYKNYPNTTGKLDLETWLVNKKGEKKSVGGQSVNFFSPHSVKYLTTDNVAGYFEHQPFPRFIVHQYFMDCRLLQPEAGSSV